MDYPLAPECVSPVVAWLATDEAGDINGQVFVVIGGSLWAMSGYTTAGQITKEGAWTIDELAAQKSTLFAEHEPMVTRSVETIIFLKSKIRKIAESSVSFVENYLETVEEIIHMLTSSSSKTKIYGMNRHLMEPGGSVFIRGEA